MKLKKKPLFRSVLRVLFQSVRLIICNVLYGVGTALTLVWSKGEYVRWLVLGCVGMRKVEAGAIEKAKRSANELLKHSSDYKDDWYYGNSIHTGNLILGRVALREGNPEAAKEYLLYAGKTRGSPQLDTFGPNMTLAMELLEAGEKEAVLEYFKLCGNFWEMDSGRLRKWAEIVQSGQIPNFGPHLLY